MTKEQCVELKRKIEDNEIINNIYFRDIDEKAEIVGCKFDKGINEILFSCRVKKKCPEEDQEKETEIIDVHPTHLCVRSLLMEKYKDEIEDIIPKIYFYTEEQRRYVIEQLLIKIEKDFKLDVRN